MVDKKYGEPLSIGRIGEFGALGGIVGAGSAEQRADCSSACALGGARGAHVAFGVGIFVAVRILRGSVGYERGHGWTESDGGAGESAIPWSVRQGCARRAASVRVVRARAALEFRKLG